MDQPLLLKIRSITAKVKRCLLLVSGLWALPAMCLLAQPDGYPAANVYLAPEFLIGPHLHIYSRYPETDLTKTLFLSLGRYQAAETKPWARFYQEPFTGIAASVTDFGNPGVFGYGLSVLPFITFHTKRLDRPAWHLRFGIGAAYYTRFFDSETNPTNKSVGGRFSWSFQLGIYRDLIVREKMRLQIGGGWLHGSNGHTSLPNFGINTLSFGLKAQFYQRPVDWSPTLPPLASPRLNNEVRASGKTRGLTLLARLGYGTHELGGPSGPVDGPGYPVYGLYLGAGKIVKQFIRLRAGLGYRYYQAYYDYITANQLEEFIDQPRWNASNFYVSAGAEFLMGHVSLDVELGTNLYKPFFSTFFDIFEEKSGFDKALKSRILQRLGLYYYLWDTAKDPPLNLGIGCHINANNGQADFTGISLMLVREIGKK